MLEGRSTIAIYGTGEFFATFAANEEIMSVPRERVFTPRGVKKNSRGGVFSVSTTALLTALLLTFAFPLEAIKPLREFAFLNSLFLGK